MDELASTATRPNLAERLDRSHGRLRAELERDYEAAFGRPVRNYLQGDLLERAASWLIRAQTTEGAEIRRSWPQVARGCGYPALSSVRETKQRQVSSLYRVFGYLREMGWVEGWEQVLEPKGNASGIVLRVGPRALSRAPEPRRSSSAGRAPVL
jgi:hypothetical protein